MSTSDSIIDQALKLVSSRGGWCSVFCFYPRIDSASNGKQIPCPFSSSIDPKSTKFRLKKGWNETGFGYHNDYGKLNGIQIIQHIENLSSPGKAAWKIIQLLNGVPASANPVTLLTSSKLSSEKLEQRKKHIEKLQYRSREANGNFLFKKYLDYRGLPPVNVSEDVRIGTKVYRSLEDKTHSLDIAMLGVMRHPTKGIVSIHRTFMNNKGESLFDTSTGKRIKMMMPPCVQEGEINGSAIHIDEPCSINGRLFLGLTEGMETAFAIKAAFQLPVWSCYSAELLRTVLIPDDVRSICIFADNDFKNHAGLSAANDLAARLRQEGKEVKILTPQIPQGYDVKESKGIDWMDIYKYSVDEIRKQVREQIVSSI